MSESKEHALTFSVLALFVLAIVLLVSIPGCKHEPLMPPIDENAGGGGGPQPDPDPCDPDSIYFEQYILPLLVSNCAIPGSHDAITHEDGVRMYDYGNIMQEVDPFDPWGSKLVEVITETDPDKLMPPPPIQSLTPAEIQLIVAWIQQGAPNNSCVGGCDTTNVTYSGTIAPWLQFKCNGCHSGSAPQGGLDLTTWAAASTVALDGRMPGAIQHQSPYVSMPPAGGMLPQCDIDKVLIWIQDGAPNN